jgi:hypothetical protein
LVIWDSALQREIGTIRYDDSTDAFDTVKERFLAE